MTANLTLTYGALNLTATPYLVPFGTDTGAPENEAIPLASFIQDGDIELSSRAGNRTITFDVLIEGANLTALATAEANLVLETEKVSNTLTVNPGDSSPAAVYEIFRGQVSLVRDDTYEIAGMRRYTVTVRALPYPRSATETVTAALGSGTQTSIPTPTSVVVDSGSSTTGWTGNYFKYDGSHTLTASGSASMSVLSGAVNAASPAGGAVIYSQIESMRTGSVDVSVTKQVVVNWQWDVATDPSLLASWRSTDFRLLVNEATTPVYLERVSGTPSPGRLTYTEAIFKVPASLSTINTARFVVNLYGFGLAGTQESLYIDSVVRNNANTSISTPRELQRTIAVAGSARTQGRVTISHETSALGDVLAYFWPDMGANFSPPLRQFRTAGGGVTADTTLVSGARENLVGATTVFTIPASRVPDGGYLLMARLGGAATTATVTWTATTILNSVDIGPTSTGTRVAAITSAYQNIAIGRIMLPTNNVNPQATTASVKITLTATVSSGSTANLDEAWIFGDFGQLTQVACGTAAPSSGGSSNRVFIRPATSVFPQPSVRLGFAADESDASTPSALSSWQPPEFKPSLTNCFTATSNALDAAVTLYHYPRWHTNPAS